MALVQFGGGVAQIVGRIGGTVFQRGRAGSQIKNLPINTGRKQRPVNVQRSRITTAATQWRNLDPTVQQEWAALAATLTRYNRLGVAYTPSGYQIWMESFLNSDYAKFGSILTAPVAYLTVPSYGAVTITIDMLVPEFTITGTITNGSDLFQWAIQATRPQGMGVQVNRQSFVTLSTTDQADTDPVDQWSRYKKAIGFSPQPGQVVFVRICAIAITTGQRSPWQLYRVVTT